jgi:16S rRNA C967 or C1407 C5-methylase (RsmB/RsmF family)/NOL1/NOP2/fmu family ribosome biogenesis protein
MKKDPTLPEDFVQRMQAELGQEYDAFAESLEQPPPVSIRMNQQKKSTQQGQPIPWCRTGFYLPERPSFTFDPEFHAGAYYVQEASSMLIEQAVKQVVDVRPALRVLDLCAAPGGKSTHLLNLINEQSLLVSNEVIHARAFVLSENIQKWGHPNCVVTNNDPVAFSRMTGFFDLIVIDAPCSGEGLFRKDPEARHEWSPGNAALCAVRQQRILHDVFPALKDNGILIYSTCTFNPEENERNLFRFSHEKKVSFIPLQFPKEWGIEEVQQENVIGYRCLPHRVNGEGFFMAVMRKESPEKNSSLAKKKLNIASQQVASRFREWLMAPDQFTLIHDERKMAVIPQSLIDEVLVIQHYLKVIYQGTALAEIKHDKKIPEHAFALSRIINRKYFPSLELSLDEAIRYLRKDPLLLGGYEKGFALAVFNNLPLGWVNVLDNRVNNLYPANWRIRMNPPKE